MSYFRHRYTSFEEFQREALIDGETLGKEELELLHELEREDEDLRPSRGRWSDWD